ncbi:MAG: SDR family oxidoreductase [Solirubrobacteraceae bacterium]
MNQQLPALDVVTGAFSYSGAHIARRLLHRGRRVRTLTHHPDREHPLKGQVEACPYRFDDPIALTRALEGVDTLYNTYWVRFDHGSAGFGSAVANSRALFHAARRAGVRRIVHLSIANPAPDSPFAYYRGKALVEHALAEVGIPFAIVRPTWIFGGDPEILANNIAWIMRRMPIFPIPGDGSYRVQPIHIDDLVDVCIDAGNAGDDLILDAAGPAAISFGELISAVRGAIGSRSPIVHVPARAFQIAARALGLVMKDVVLTSEEISALTSGLLVSSEPPRGKIAFTTWITEHEIGHAYANELSRHFTPSPESGPA